LWWVPLCPLETVEPLGFSDLPDRSRRLHLLLDAYGDAHGHDADRRAFGEVIIQRARRQAAAIRRMADGGDPAAARLLFVADAFEAAAADVAAQPDGFWAR
jgi:hypothetical protein